MAYRGLTIIFASFLLFLGHCGYSNGQCTDATECMATDLGTHQYLERDPPGNAQGCYSDTESVTLSCRNGTGTLLDGPSENTCDNGTWVNASATCTAFNCPAPSSMDENLDWTDKDNQTYRGDQTIEYSCPEGFKLEGSETNTCIDQDDWENEDPTCSAFNCSAPSTTDENLDWTDKGNQTYNGDQTIEYSCPEGFKLEGSETNTCVNQDQWQNGDPTCNSGNVVQVFWYFFLMTTFYSIFSFYM